MKLHDKYAKDYKSRQNGEQWFSTAIKIIFEQIFCVWKSRNAAQHGIDKQSRREALLHRHIAHIQQIYRDIERIDCVDRQSFSRPMHEILGLPTRALERWIHHSTAFLKDAMQRATKRDKLQMPAISTYFKPIITKHHSTLPAQPTRRIKAPKANLQSVLPFKTIRSRILKPRPKESANPTKPSPDKTQFPPRIKIAQTITQFFSIKSPTRNHVSEDPTTYPDTFQPP